MRIQYKLNNLFLLLTLTIASFPILTFGMRSMVIFLWTVSGLLLFTKRVKRNILGKDIYLFVIPFLLLILSLFYSKNIDDGISLIIKMISFVIFPLIFYLNKNLFDKKSINKILLVFAFSTCFIVFYQIICVLLDYNFITQEITIEEIKSNGYERIEDISQLKIDEIKVRRFRNFIIKISNTHTTYQGLWIAFSLYILGSNFVRIQKRIFKFLIAIPILLLIIWFFIISARMPIMAFVTSLSLLFLVFSKLPLHKKIFFSLIFPIILVFLMFFKNPFSTRVKQYYNSGFSLPQKHYKSDKFNSSNVRNGIYFCDLELIKKHYLTGVGIGDIQESLNSCYESKLGAKVYTWRNYNTHNQYAFFWICSGIFGFLSFTILIFGTFFKSVKSRNKSLFILICISSIIFFSENLLERSDGVTFFFFFVGLLYYNNTKPIKFLAL